MYVLARVKKEICETILFIYIIACQGDWAASKPTSTNSATTHAKIMVDR